MFVHKKKETLTSLSPTTLCLFLSLLLQFCSMHQTFFYSTYTFLCIQHNIFSAFLHISCPWGPSLSKKILMDLLGENFMFTFLYVQCSTTSHALVAPLPNILSSSTIMYEVLTVSPSGSGGNLQIVSQTRSQTPHFSFPSSSLPYILGLPIQTTVKLQRHMWAKLPNLSRHLIYMKISTALCTVSAFSYLLVTFTFFHHFHLD